MSAITFMTELMNELERVRAILRQREEQLALVMKEVEKQEMKLVGLCCQNGALLIELHDLKKALAARERAVWLAAANKCHECLLMTTEDREKFDDLQVKELMHGRCQAFANFEEWCKQQAEAVKP